jgi:predicted ribosome quality control (RQC) complex YloA/Tae2 family protein
MTLSGINWKKLSIKIEDKIIKIIFFHLTQNKMSFKTETKYIPALSQEITFHIGKSAEGNFEIIDNADENDLWFHVEGDSSAHVIASLPDDIDRKKITYIVKQGAILCRQNSRLKSSKTAVKIIYTRIKNIEKTDIPGKVQVTNGTVISV